MAKPSKSQWDFGELFSPEQTRRVLAWKIEIERRLGQMDATLGNYATGGLPSAQRSIGQEVRRTSAALRAQARQLVEFHLLRKRLAVAG